MDRQALSLEIEERLHSARSAAALTGAGISAESGLGTFRGPGGLWEEFRPEELATPEAFLRQPARVWRWYAERYRRMATAEPNAAHRALIRWQEQFPSFVVVTQNIDRLHQRAGSSDVVELHGTIHLARCHYCDQRRPMEELAGGAEEPPKCSCGGLFRPAVVWFGEVLPQAEFARAARAARAADIFLAVGTSGTVFPAAGLIELAYRSGALVIEINPEPTAFSDLAHLRLGGEAGEALPWLTEELLRCRPRAS